MYVQAGLARVGLVESYADARVVRSGFVAVVVDAVAGHFVVAGEGQRVEVVAVPLLHLHPVAVRVRVARIAQAVAVQVRLPRIGHAHAVVHVVVHHIVVVVGPGVGIVWEGILGVRHAIVVVIVVKAVGNSVAVEVGIPLVLQRVQVFFVRHPVTVVVAVRVVADPVAVVVSPLARVLGKQVIIVRHPIAVEVLRRECLLAAGHLDNVQFENPGRRVRGVAVERLHYYPDIFHLHPLHWERREGVRWKRNLHGVVLVAVENEGGVGQQRGVLGRRRHAGDVDAGGVLHEGEPMQHCRLAEVHFEPLARVGNGVRGGVEIPRAHRSVTVIVPSSLHLVEAVDHVGRLTVAGVAPGLEPPG